MSADLEKIYDLIDEIQSMQHGQTQIALAEEAVRLADLAGDEALAMDARFELISATTHGGESEKAMVAYSWCLKKYDENPENYDLYTLFWQYKWILDSLWNFPNISREKIDAVFADARNRFLQNNISLRPIFGALCILEASSGNETAAGEHYRQWLAEPRDFFADCLACEVNRQAEYLISVRRDEEAIKIAEPILQGKMSCSEVPHLTFAQLLLPLHRTGNLELASELCVKGYKMIAANKDFLLSVAQQIYFLTAVTNFNQAARLFEKHFVWAIKTKNLREKFEFCNSVLVLLDQLEADQLTFDLPKDFPDYKSDGQYDRAAFKAYFLSETQKIAAAFDRRNDNSFYADKIGKSLHA